MRNKLKIRLIGDSIGWYWQAKINGRVIAESKTYPTKWNCKRALQSFLTYLQEERFEIVELDVPIVEVGK